SASPPTARALSPTHSAARRTSAAWDGAALTLGIARKSPRSPSQPGRRASGARAIGQQRSRAAAKAHTRLLARYQRPLRRSLFHGLRHESNRGEGGESDE